MICKNRERLLNEQVAQSFFKQVLERVKAHLSDGHFTMDGTLMEAWASQKGFQKKGGEDDGEGGQFRGQKSSNETYESKTDQEAKLYRKGGGQQASLAIWGRCLGRTATA